MSTIIRNATDNDVSIVTRLIRDSFKDVATRFNLTPENCPKHPSNCTEAWLISAFEKEINYYILESGNVPCGCVALERANPDICYLERLAVLPQFRNRGYGRQLVQYCLDQSRKIGAKRVEIGIIDEHRELKDWYISSGFFVKKTQRFDHLPFTVTFMFIEL